jgi:acyl carrier protein
VAYDFYNQKFANAGDFTFYFVGNVDEAALKTLATKYFAILPSAGAAENFNDNGYRPVYTAADQVWEKGNDPKSMMQILYSGEMKKFDETENIQFDALAEVIDIKMTEILREELGGVYSTGVRSSMTPVPYPFYSMVLIIPCGPENVEKLKTSALNIVKNVINNGPDQKDLDKYKEEALNELRDDLKKNSTWMDFLTDYQVNGGDKYLILNKENLIKSVTLSQIQNLAKKYLTTDHRLIATLMPEDGWQDKVAEKNAPAQVSNIREKIISDVAATVKAIIVDQLGVDEADVTPNADFTRNLGAGELDMAELIMRFEKEFGISIPDDEAEDIWTVGDAISYIEAQKYGSASSIIDNYLHALGGESKLKNVKTLLTEGMILAGGMEMQTVIKQMYPNKSHSETYCMGQTMIQNFDGRKGYMAQGTMKMDMPDEMIAAMKDAVLIDALKFVALKIVSVQMQTIDGKDCYVLTNAEGEKNYFDKTTWLLYRTETSEGITTIKTYGEFDGMMFPTEIIQAGQGQEVIIKATKITVNKGVTEKDFD